MMHFQSFVEWVFLGVLSGGVYILWLMSQSLSDLNTKIAILLEKQEQQGKILEDHEERIREGERERSKK